MKKVKLYADRDMTVEEILDQNHISRHLRRHLKASGHIMKDNKILYMKKMVKAGDIITLYIDEEESDIVPIDLNLNIVYEDNELMVIDKPYGIPVMATLNMHETTLLNGIAYHFKEEGIEAKIHVVNRLDKDTTGLMMIGKDRFSTMVLADALKATLKRRYFAIVQGKMTEKKGTINLPIAKENEMSIRRVVRNDGKPSITNYEVVKEFGDYSLLDIELLTGRTHQIRVVFSFLGHPLVGDQMYSMGDGEKNLMLHSHFLEFVHPKTHEKKTMETGLPERFQKFIKDNGGTL